MSYEYFLVELASLLIGDTIGNYLLVTGIFILFLGLGSLVYEKMQTRFSWHNFILIEILISILSLASLGVLLLSIESLILTKLSLYFFMSVIAFISGFELPFLLKKANGDLAVMSFDYLGMIFAGVFFSSIILKHFGIFEMLITFSLSNLTLALICCACFKKYKTLSFLVIFSVTIFLSKASLSTWAREAFLNAA